VKPALLALLLLTGCAHWRHAGEWTFSGYGSAHLGADVRAVMATQQERDVILHCVQDLGFPMNRVEEAIQTAEVHWVDKPWRGSDGHLWSGMTDGHVITVTKGGPYKHELCHLVFAFVKGIPDANHVLPWWSACTGSPTDAEGVRFGDAVPPLGPAVPLVVQRSPDEEVIRVDARRVVALVARDHAFGDGAAQKLPSEAVGADGLILEPKLPVAQRHARTGPHPAATGRGLVHLGPEARNLHVKRLGRASGDGRRILFPPELGGAGLGTRPPPSLLHGSGVDGEPRPANLALPLDTGAVSGEPVSQVLHAQHIPRAHELTHLTAREWRGSPSEQGATLPP
jgi:hypothetical protein